MAEELLAMQKAEKEASGQKYHPPQALWSPTIQVLTEIKDMLAAFKHQEIAIALAKAGKSAGDGPKPSPRPRTAITQVKVNQELQKHRSLVARMLPHKAQNEDPVD